MNECAIIILNYNTWQDTINEIEHVHRMFGIDFNNFMVIDNNSSNESYIRLLEFAKNKSVMLLKSETNGGYAKGNNIGLRYAYSKGYRYALILNNDIEFVDKNTLNIFINCLKSVTNLAVINSDICSPEGKVFNRDSVRPSFFDLTFGMLNYIKKGRKLDMIDDIYAYVYRPQGCCMMVDLKCMNDIDYFDEHTFLYNEEIILAERLLNKGYRCACAPGYKVIHHTSKTIKSIISKKQIISYYISGYKYYIEKYRQYGKIMVEIALLFYIVKLLIIL